MATPNSPPEPPIPTSNRRTLPVPPFSMVQQHGERYDVSEGPAKGVSDWGCLYRSTLKLLLGREMIWRGLLATG